MATKRRRGQPPLNATYVMQRMPMQPLLPALPYKRRRRQQRQQSMTLAQQVAASGAHMVVVRALVPAATPAEQVAAEWALRQLAAGAEAPVKVRTEPLEEGLGVTVGPFILERGGRQGMEMEEHLLRTIHM